MKLREWFVSLNRREQALVAAVAALVLFTVLFLAVWEPLFEGTASARADAADLKSLIAKLSQARGQSGGTPGGVARGGSLLSVVDQTVKQSGLTAALKRMQPEGETTVRVWLEQADFAAVARWLGSLSTTYGVQVSDAVVNREAQSGQVRARIDLVRSSP